ncbi:MAG: ABC transporter substrate-binding protein, partial [Synergistaceae bacterium]|nr:ABC transporter substrate-binding protein [Synergistaceae bacterium]
MKKRYGLIGCLSMVILLALLAGLYGCGEAGAGVPTQELVIGENIDLGGYDPTKDMSAFVRFLIFDSLVELGYDYEKIPGLATEWNMSPDGKTWMFRLRQGVKFHDGEPWNAEAARVNFQHRVDGGGTGFYTAIESMETPDEYTFVVHLSRPIFTFASDISVPSYGMISPSAFDENHKVTAAVGTGPFRLDSWAKDAEFVMTANKEFYDGAPKLQKLVFKVIVDGNSRAMALESGEIDMMSGRNALTSLESLKKMKNIQILKVMGQTSEIVMLNTFDKTLSNPDLRRAIAASINFPATVPALLTDLAEPAENFFSPVFGRFVDSDFKLPRYDPDTCGEYMVRAGYELSGGFYRKNGEKLTLELLVGSQNEEDKALAAVMREQLGKNGIDLVISLMDAAAINARIGAREYQMAMQGQNYVPTDDPSVHYRNGYYHSKSFYNTFSSAEMDAKVDALFNSLNEAERLTLHRELQKEITAQVPVIMMFHRNNII